MQICIYRNNNSASRFDDAKLSIFAGGRYQRSVTINRQRINHVVMAADCLDDLTIVWDVPNIDLYKNEIINTVSNAGQNDLTVPSDRNQHWTEHYWRSDAIPAAKLSAYGLTALISSRLNLLSVHSLEFPISLSVKKFASQNKTI